MAVPELGYQTFENLLATDDHPNRNTSFTLSVLYRTFGRSPLSLKNMRKQKQRDISHPQE
jgi:hypothetical protein